MLLAALLTAANVLLTAAALRCSLSLPHQLSVHLGLWLLAGGCWAGTVLCLLRRAPPLRGLGVLLVLGALLLRGAGWVTPPRHSDDTHRYLFDGAVQLAGLSPYLGPPGAAVYGGVEAAAAHRERLNNRHLPTVYPPAAQLAFRLSAALARRTGWAPLHAWKGLVAVVDGLILLLLAGLLRARGQHPGWLAVWALSPLCAVELGQEAHLDALGILGLLGALYGLARGGLLGAVAAGVSLVVGVLVKPLAAALLPGVLRQRRGVALGVLVGVVLGGAGLCALYWPTPLPGSLGEYGRRWRGNDGAFAILQGAAEQVVRRVYLRPWEEWGSPGLARLVSGRSRGTVWPDELAGFVARGVVVGLLLGLALRLHRRRVEAGRAAYALVGAALLLGPMLHPWYVLWALALCPLWPRLAPPALVLGVLVPLGYVPLGDFLRGAPWQDPLWTRVVEHGAVVLALVWVTRARRAGGRLAGWG